MSAFDRLSRMCGPQVPPELLALLGEYRAEVLNEAADELAASSNSHHRNTADRLRAMAAASAEEAAVRRSVDAQFPKVAAFLAEENTTAAPSQSVAEATTCPHCGYTSSHCGQCGEDMTEVPS